ncbi:MAG: glycosyltransferase family 4 protein [Bacteroidota bacterium]
MKNLLYIGNKLSSHGLNKTTIETLGSLLVQEGYVLTYASSQKNQYLRILDMLWCVLKNKKLDYILIDTYSTSSFWYAFLTSQLCRVLKLKYIPILHGGNLPYRLQKNPNLCKMVFGNAFQNVAPSPYLLRAFQKHGYSNLSCIPNVLQMEGYPFKERARLQPKLLWVRAFAAIYNPKMAIEVLLTIKQKYPEAELCMVGPDKDGSLEETKKYAQSLNLAMTFTGGLTKEEWISLSEEYDIFINTTHFDNTPVSVMEAMALGLPVVSTNVGGIPYLLTDKQNALLVNDNDTQEMVAKIDYLLQHPEVVTKLTTNARKKAEQLDWEVVKTQWMALLD